MENDTPAPVNHETLELPAALAKARATRDLSPVFQWMVDHGKKPMDEVLQEVSAVTGVSVRTKGQLVAALKQYAGIIDAAFPPFVCFQAYKNGTFMAALPSGVHVHAFIPRDFAAVAGVPLEKIEKLLRDRRVQPVAEGVYLFQPLRIALEALRKGGQS